MNNDLFEDTAIIAADNFIEMTEKALEEIDRYFKAQCRDRLCSMAIENQLQTAAMYALEMLVKCYRPNIRSDQGALFNLLLLIIDHSPHKEVRQAAVLESIQCRLHLAGA